MTATSIIRAVLLSSLLGCDSSTGLESGAEARTLAAAAAKWEATATPSYRFTLQRFCECLYTSPLRVTVRNGVVLRAQVIDTGDFLLDTELGAVQTVPQIFTILARALDLPAASFFARYDPTWGFPTEASIDHSRQVVDDEFSFRLSDFAAIP
ncbi:MAG: DUF6174 domain-containing protein [Gemmatimonadetes bacterium]|nr:DUF6174 domain-containing protein [Gemmatimonadota bacterium]